MSLNIQKFKQLLKSFYVCWKCHITFVFYFITSLEKCKKEISGSLSPLSSSNNGKGTWVPQRPVGYVEH